MKLPPVAEGLLGMKEEESPYEGVDGYFNPQTTMAEQTYHAVRRARAENGIVLQVDEDSTPIRVLPLPAEGKAVYVSNLLRDTGVQAKLGFIEATLFRHSTDTISGIPMAVNMTRDGLSVRPETDYSLQPGDRLRVSKAANPAVQGLFDAVLGR